MDAEYVRIETYGQNGNWQVLKDNVSQIYHYALIQNHLLKLIRYRIISVGLHNKTATSEEVIGWRLNAPNVLKM